MPSPRLSLCMIVKNEARTLERCLSTARSFVDEIVIVDTGSTDETPIIAQRFADVYDEIAWPGSFAKARNYSMDLATGTHLIILDGDEYLPEPAHWEQIRAAIRYPQFAALQLPVRNLLADNQVVAADRIWQERVFKNVPAMRYEGRVHNQIQAAAVAYAQAAGEELARLEAEIIHTGYALSPEAMRVKYAPRLELLQAEYNEAETPEHRSYYGFQLGLVYFVLDQYEEAAEVFNAIDYGVMAPDNAFYARMLAAQTGLKLEDAPMALVHANAMLAVNQREPIAFVITGLALLLAQQFGDGLLMLLEAYAMNEDGQASVRFVLSAPNLLGFLAKICDRFDLHDHARAFQRVRETSTPNPQVVRTLMLSLQHDIVQAERAA